MAADDTADLLDRLAEDHRALQVRFSELAGLPLGDPQRKTMADRAGAELAKHLAAEETLLYPLANRNLPPGQDAVDEGLAAHAALQALVRELAGQDADSPDFDRLLAQLVETATGHFGAEEAQVFTAVRGSVPGDWLHVLGDRVPETERDASLGERIRSFFRTGPRR